MNHQKTLTQNKFYKVNTSVLTQGNERTDSNLKSTRSKRINNGSIYSYNSKKIEKSSSRKEISSKNEGKQRNLTKINSALLYDILKKSNNTKEAKDKSLFNNLLLGGDAFSKKFKKMNLENLADKINLTSVKNVNNTNTNIVNNHSKYSYKKKKISNASYDTHDNRDRDRARSVVEDRRK